MMPSNRVMKTEIALMIITEAQGYCVFGLTTACNQVGYHISVELENLGMHSVTLRYQVLKAVFLGTFRDALALER